MFEVYSLAVIAQFWLTFLSYSSSIQMEKRSLVLDSVAGIPIKRGYGTHVTGYSHREDRTRAAEILTQRGIGLALPGYPHTAWLAWAGELQSRSRRHPEQARSSLPERITGCCANC